MLFEGLGVQMMPRCAACLKTMVTFISRMSKGKHPRTQAAQINKYFNYKWTFRLI